MQEQIVFGENQKVMEIDIKTLEASADYRNPNEKKFPMSHCDVISEITDMLEAKNLEFEIADMFITEKGTVPGTQKQVDRINKRRLKDNPKAKDLVKINDTSVTIIREMICSIRVLGEYTNDDMGFVIGVSQNEKGFVFGVGARVAICSNFTIMGASDTFKNYGKDSTSFDNIIELIENRIDNIADFWTEQQTFIKNLMSIRLESVTERDSIIGSLLSLAVKGAYIDSTLEVPLNISEVSKLAANMLNYDEVPDKLISIWDFFNHVTTITSSSNRLEGRILQSAATGRYFTERYSLDETIDVVDLNEDNDAVEAIDLMENDNPSVVSDGKAYDTKTGEEEI